MTGRRRLRMVLIALGVFVVLLGSAAVLYRVGEPSGGGASDRPTAVVPSESRGSSSDRTGDAAPDQTGDAAPDEAGATATALDYASAPQSWLYMTDEEIREAVGQLATPEAAGRLADVLIEEISSARADLARSTGPVWWIVHPLAWKVETFGQNRATVSVWTFSFLSAADVAVPQTEWTTTSFDLEWVEGSWRVATFRDTPGPTPAIGATDQPWEPEPLDDALEGFTRLTWGEFG